MPVIGFRFTDFKALYGDPVEQEPLVDRLTGLGGDIDRVDGDEIHIEYFPDRPDLVSVEGIARAMRSFDGHEPGVRTYKTEAPEGELVVDASVAAVRPYILACHVRGLAPLDDVAIKDIMDFQERLGNGIGRRRRRVAIGIHDAARIEAPYRYTTVDGAFRFEPLQADGKMSVDELLADHPKGRAFAHLLPDGGPFPVILDKDGHLLSLPPVINGTRTALVPGTTDMLLDLTGPDLVTLHTAMGILATAFADRGAKIVPLTIGYPQDDAYADMSGRTLTAPDLAPQMHTVSVRAAERILGFGLKRPEIIECLNRMGHDASPCGKDDDEVHAYTPRWRGDILHEVDLIEDIAKGYGYDNVEPKRSRVPTHGRGHPTEKRASLVRSAFIGYGFLEATTLTISNPGAQYAHWGLPEPTGAEGPVLVANPATEDHTALRSWLVPSLFHVLAANRHRDYPQALFEVGQVVDPELDHSNAWHVAAVEASSKAGFTRVKGVAEGFLRDLGIADARLEEDDHPGFIPGRVARYVRDDVVLGRFGEVHPAVLERYEVGVPVTAIEFDLHRTAPTS